MNRIDELNKKLDILELESAKLSQEIEEMMNLWQAKRLEIRKTELELMSLQNRIKEN